jgi:hypothetical protein
MLKNIVIFVQFEANYPRNSFEKASKGGELREVEHTWARCSNLYTHTLTLTRERRCHNIVSATSPYSEPAGSHGACLSFILYIYTHTACSSLGQHISPDHIRYRVCGLLERFQQLSSSSHVPRVRFNKMPLSILWI